MNVLSWWWLLLLAPGVAVWLSLTLRPTGKHRRPKLAPPVEVPVSAEDTFSFRRPVFTEDEG